VLASRVPRDAVEATGKGAKQKGGMLPPHVMVYFAMALAPFAEEDYEETWGRMSQTLAALPQAARARGNLDPQNAR